MAWRGKWTHYRNELEFDTSSHNLNTGLVLYSQMLESRLKHNKVSYIRMVFDYRIRILMSQTIWL